MFEFLFSASFLHQKMYIVIIYLRIIWISFFFLLHTAQIGGNIILPLKAHVTFGYLFSLCFLHLDNIFSSFTLLIMSVSFFSFNHYHA